MANKKKYSDEQRQTIIYMYGVDRVLGGVDENGKKFSSKGKYTLLAISEETGVPIPAVVKIVKASGLYNG